MALILIIDDPQRAREALRTFIQGEWPEHECIAVCDALRLLRP